MAREYFTRLTITIEASGGDNLDDLNTTTTTISSDMSDCSVHAYYKLFDQVLAMLGFSEEIIAMGAAQSAFNEMRPVELMRKVARAYDLKLLEDLIDEDLNASSGGSDAPVA